MVVTAVAQKNFQYCDAKKFKDLCKCLDCTYKPKGDDCVKDFKKGCGAPKFKGDGFCDDNNNHAGCAWDGGDCCGPKANKQYCKACLCQDCTKKKVDPCIAADKIEGSCKFPNWFGDGNCDDENNNAGCSWDGGDCCGTDKNYKFCKACACRDCTVKTVKCPGTSKGCTFPNYQGDGNCDDENNTCKCGWDGGDCCVKTVGGAVKTSFCKACKCLDPESKSDSNCEGTCKLPNYKGDGNCDDENNNCGCAYDGGDCCAKSLKKKVNTQYCKECKCLDPQNQPDSNCKGTCKFPNYKGDGNCDDENNNCGCGYDGGDCCVKSLKNGGKVNTKYCNECKCLDPNNQ